MTKTLFLLVAVILLSFGSLFSQNTYEFLRVQSSARAGALGGSFLTYFDDADIIFYNPAGMKLTKNSPISFSFTKY
jgi:long-subunit fatty acid transport protein